MPFPFAHEVSFLNHQVGTGRCALVRNAQGVRVFLRLVLVEYLAAKKGEEGFFFRKIVEVSRFPEIPAGTNLERYPPKIMGI